MKADDAESTVSGIRKRNLMWLRTVVFQKKLEAESGGHEVRGADKLFSQEIGLNPKYFGHIKNGRRNVGNPLAREVERVFDRPIGWMDAEHTEAAGATRDENEVVAAALRLFRLNPAEARRVLMNALNDHLDTLPGRKPKK